MTMDVGKSPIREGEGRRIVDLVYRDEDALRQAYFNFIKGGGLFFSSTQNYSMKDVVFLRVLLPEDQAPTLIRSTVVWVAHPDLFNETAQEIGVQLQGSEGLFVQNRIQALLDDGKPLSPKNQTI